MKTLRLISAMMLVTPFAFAQESDTVYLGASYINNVYYSLNNGIESSDINNDWDIAFQTESAFSTSILINPATGTELYLYPNDTSDWTTLDTTGMKGSWTRLHNSDTSWDYGAFSQNQTSMHVGWGLYNITTHQIHGDKLFVIKLGNGIYQKVWIKSLIGSTYTFRHATLNNSVNMQHTLNKADYTGKNFGFYSLQNHNQKDKEPDATDWDLFFGKYTAFVPSSYTVTGVLHSSQTQSSKAYPLNDAANYTDWQQHTLSNAISTIGYDWKTFNMTTFVYDLADSTVYFVRTQHGDVWKIIFDYFGGSADGAIGFNKTHVHFAGIGEVSKVSLFDVYPNPASENVTIAYTGNSSIQLDVTDLSGRIVKSEVLSSSALTHTLDISDIGEGLYLISLTSEGERVTKRLLIK